MIRSPHRHTAFHGAFPVSLAATLLAASCGGGGNGFAPPPETDALPGGVWEGTVTINANPIAVELAGASTDAGELRLVNSLGGAYFASLEAEHDALTGTVRVFAPPGGMFADETTVTTGQVAGTIVQRTRMSGTFTLASGDTGTFELFYDDLYERNSSLLLLGGMWEDPFGTVYTVQADGSFFAQDDLGCVYDGTVSVIDPDFNAYDVALGITQCGELDGALDGLAVLDDVAFEGDNHGIVAIVSNDAMALVLVLERR